MESTYSYANYSTQYIVSMIIASAMSMLVCSTAMHLTDDARKKLLIPLVKLELDEEVLVSFLIVVKVDGLQ